MTDVERELITAQRRQKRGVIIITLSTLILSSVLCSWSHAVMLTAVVAIVSWGVFSSPIEHLEDIRTIRKD